MMRFPIEPCVRGEELAAADVLLTTLFMTRMWGYHESPSLLDTKNAAAIYGNGIREEKKS